MEKGKENKKEEPDDYTGEKFLVNKDQEHKDLLARLNKMIKAWETLNDGAKNLSQNTEIDKDIKESQITTLEKDIAGFVSNHYKTFVARLQLGVDQSLVRQLFSEINGVYKYKGARKFLKEVKDRGLILAIGLCGYGSKVYLINPDDEKKTTLKKIEENITVNENAQQKETTQEKNGGCGAEEKKALHLNNIVVVAHPHNNFEKILKDNVKNDTCGKLILIPHYDSTFSFISAMQTRAVENCCSIVNYFIGKRKEYINGYPKWYVERHIDKQPMIVELEGGSQGVDFISKMVGSTHNRNDSRIHDANIILNFNAPHLFQDVQKIVKRLISGVSDEKNKNTITHISVKNDMDRCKHPTCKAKQLFNLLKVNKNKIGENVTLLHNF